ncbi:MAG: lipocalin family protein [Rikenellaceae bacterium]|nr:lipocalin family protein [Rikenellaceae bacterium]
MKKNWFYLMMMLFAVAFVGCNDDDETYVEPQLDVTIHNLAGEWMLKSWSNGQELTEGTYLYLNLVRNDATFKLYDNLNSFQAVLTTGRFALATDPELGVVIRGEYDYGVGEWNHRYIITSLTASEMVWVAKDDTSDVSVYVRAEIPAEVIAEAE